MIVAKFSTLAGGVFIEQRDEAEYQPDTRCFRFDSAGRAEYAQYADCVARGAGARWFGHVFTERDFLLA